MVVIYPSLCRRWPSHSTFSRVSVCHDSVCHDSVCHECFQLLLKNIKSHGSSKMPPAGRFRTEMFSLLSQAWMAFWVHILLIINLQLFLLVKCLSLKVQHAKLSQRARDSRKKTITVYFIINIPTNNFGNYLTLLRLPSQNTIDWVA